MLIAGFPLLPQLGASPGLLMPSPLHMQLLQGQGQLLQGQGQLLQAQHSLPLIGQQYLPITPDSSPSTSVPSTASSDVITHDTQSKDHMTHQAESRSMSKSPQMSRSPHSINIDYSTPQVSSASRNVSPHGHPTPLRTSPHGHPTPLKTSPHEQSTPLRTSPHAQSTPLRTSPNEQSTLLRTSPHAQSTPLRTSPCSQHDLTPTRPEALPLLSPHPIGQLIRPEFTMTTTSTTKCKQQLHCNFLRFIIRLD